MSQHDYKGMYEDLLRMQNKAEAYQKTDWNRERNKKFAAFIQEVTNFRVDLLQRFHKPIGWARIA